jgi:hypothetical protein
VVPSKQSLFWSLQADSKIGISLSYKPVMIASLSTNHHVTSIKIATIPEEPKKTYLLCHLQMGR